MSVSPDIVAGGVAVLVGNPVPGSRTAVVATALAEGLLGSASEPAEVVELADLVDARWYAEDPLVSRTHETIARARLVVLATPVYQASFTGLLKVFLEGLEPAALASTAVVPVVLAGSGAHGALADLQLRIVLQAVGASVPVPSLVLEERELDRLPDHVDAWVRRFGPAVDAVAAALHGPGVAA